MKRDEKTGRFKSERPLVDRFWDNVAKGKSDECWLWTGGKDRDGYGEIGYRDALGKKRKVRAHRFSLSLIHGPLPRGKNVCHSCDTPACVNPDHLWLGSHRDNQLDKVRKHRHARGERNGSAVLSVEQVREIRKRWANDGVTQVALAKDYPVSRAAIQAIVTGRLWKEVE